MRIQFQKTYGLLCCLLTLSLGGCASLGAKEPSDEEINAEAAKAYTEVKAKSKVSSDPSWNEIVNRVAKRIEVASGENFQWEVTVIDSPEVNAWCMPGGKIAVYTGILPVVKTEGALAAVLGHEVAHAVRRHGKQQYARAINDQYAGLAIGAATVLGGQVLCKTDTCRTLTAVGGAGAGFAITFFELKYSRGDETEADKYGQEYMAKAGYDPAESIILWDRMSQANKGSSPPEFLSSHPSDANRKANLTSWLPETEALYQKAPQKYGVGVSIPPGH